MNCCPNDPIWKIHPSRQLDTLHLNFRDPFEEIVNSQERGEGDNRLRILEW